MTITEISNVIR